MNVGVCTDSIEVVAFVPGVDPEALEVTMEKGLLSISGERGEMLREWERKFPGRIENMFSAMQSIVPSHLLDTQAFDFKGLKATGVADEEGDKAFDPPEFPAPSPLRIVQL